MQMADYKPEWLEILKTQEELLRAEKFDAEDALRLGLTMIRLARDEYCAAVSIRIILGGQRTFSYLMQGTNTFNEWWMDKKLNTSRLTGVSSLRSLVEVGMGLRPMESEFENENDFTLCGGCFVLRNRAGKLLGYVECSGMRHQQDHQLIADALSELLNVKIPSLAD